MRDAVAPGWLVEIVRPRRAPPPWPLMIRAAVAVCVYRSLVTELRAVGSGGFEENRRAVTNALNVAYDQVLTTRSRLAGRDPRLIRLAALLNHSHLVTEAVTRLSLEGTRPPDTVINAVAGLADSIENGTPPPPILPPWESTPGAIALTDALAGASRLLVGRRSPDPGLLTEQRHRRSPGELVDEIDTLLGCAIALLVGYAPWPRSWQAHLPGQFADAVSHVARYTEAALVEASPDRRRLRRQTYRELSDLRAEFQRAMSEPPRVSHQATAWWPALVALEQVMDAVTSTAVAVEHGAPAPPAGAAGRFTGALDEIAAAVRAGRRPPADVPLPSGQALAPITDAVRGVLAVAA